MQFFFLRKQYYSSFLPLAVLICFLELEFGVLQGTNWEKKNLGSIVLIHLNNFALPAIINVQYTLCETPFFIFQTVSVCTALVLYITSHAHVFSFKCFL